mmetsp:Transcript_25121/g.40798  ORF Transcript_25121/g.40798 Transcript_25121/m.40798 type:complete len:365 (+) Transcript_25121:1171-2265(+)
MFPSSCASLRPSSCLSASVEFSNFSSCEARRVSSASNLPLVSARELCMELMKELSFVSNCWISLDLLPMAASVCPCNSRRAELSALRRCSVACTAARAFSTACARAVDSWPTVSLSSWKRRRFSSASRRRPADSVCSASFRAASLESKASECSFARICTCCCKPEMASSKFLLLSCRTLWISTASSSFDATSSFLKAVWMASRELRSRTNCCSSTAALCFPSLIFEDISAMRVRMSASIWRRSAHRKTPDSSRARSRSNSASSPVLMLNSDPSPFKACAASSSVVRRPSGPRMSKGAVKPKAPATRDFKAPMPSSGLKGTLAALLQSLTCTEGTEAPSIAIETAGTGGNGARKTRLGQGGLMGS